MKKKLFYSLVFFLILGTGQVNAQKFGDAKSASKNEQHALAVEIAAKVYKKKAKTKYADFIVIEYALALKEIEKYETDMPTKDLGYDILASQCAIWVDMYSALSKISPTIKGKKGAVTTVNVDYSAKLKEYTTKGMEQNYAAGKKLVDSKNIVDRKQAIKHFKRVEQLNNGKDYQEAYSLIVKAACTIAVDTISNGIELKEKEVSIEYFELADKYGYKESWKPKIADIYYNEGKKNIEGTTKFSKKVDNVDEYFTKALEYNKPHRDIADLSAKVYYDEALTYSEEKPNYEKMAEAYKLYSKASDYKSDYKDVATKKAYAFKKKNIRLYIIDVDGTCTSNSKLVSYLDEKFIVEKIDDKFPNTESLKKLVGKNAVIIKLSDKITVKYSHTPRTTTTKSVTSYFLTGDDGKWVCAGKLLYDSALKNKTKTASEAKKMTGTITKVKEVASINSSFAMEVWDMRNDSPLLLKTKKLSKSNSFVYEVDSFEGPSEVKKCKLTPLKNRRDEIPAEKDAQAYKVKNIGEAFAQSDLEKFAKFLDNKTKYQ